MIDDCVPVCAYCAHAVAGHDGYCSDACEEEGARELAIDALADQRRGEDEDDAALRLFCAAVEA